VPGEALAVVTVDHRLDAVANGPAVLSAEVLKHAPNVLVARGDHVRDGERSDGFIPQAY
jgi:hypothetical protein